MLKLCQQCGAMFDAARSSRMYCSQSCNEAAHRQRKASRITHPDQKTARQPLHMQPCWTCAKAIGGCRWSRSGSPKPIPGWEAEERIIPPGVKSYKIISCPEYVPDARQQREAK